MTNCDARAASISLHDARLKTPADRPRRPAATAAECGCTTRSHKGAATALDGAQLARLDRFIESCPASARNVARLDNRISKGSVHHYLAIVGRDGPGDRADARHRPWRVIARKLPKSIATSGDNDTTSCDIDIVANSIRWSCFQHSLDSSLRTCWNRASVFTQPSDDSPVAILCTEPIRNSVRPKLVNCLCNTARLCTWP